MNRPRALKEGMTIGLIAPSGARNNDIILPRTKAFWERLGYKIVVGESCVSRHGHLAGTDEIRAWDINRFFADDSVDAIFCIRGGYGSARLLPMLDYDMIRRHPKIFLGFSDITALHAAFNRYGRLVTFHGPNGDISIDDENQAISFASLMQALQSREGYEIINPPALNAKPCRAALPKAKLWAAILPSLPTAWARPMLRILRERFFFWKILGSIPTGWMKCW